MLFANLSTMADEMIESIYKAMIGSVVSPATFNEARAELNALGFNF